jgi:hypothetical protein
LHAYGYTLAAVYAAYFLYAGWLGLWLVNGKGVPRYHDFTTAFAAGLLALRGNVGSIYASAEFLKAQDLLIGTTNASHGTWPYPPTYLLILALLAMLPYVVAFLVWSLGTLLGFVGVVYLIVRRSSAIPLVLASPFTASNFLFGQSGFLTASLIGATLLALERWPVLAGVFLGCLTFKPQFGILFPLALVAAKQWRAIAGTIVTTALLAVLSVVVFGTGPWESLPREFVAQADVNFVSFVNWGLFQTVYGGVRYLGGGAGLAWLAQGITASGIAVIVWTVWRSQMRYPLKAATLSAAALIVTPYAFPYDICAIAIPVAFLAQDQIRWGLLKGEQTAALVLFAASFLIIAAGTRAPIGALILPALLSLIVRRGLGSRAPATSAPEGHRGRIRRFDCERGRSDAPRRDAA